MGFRYKKRSMDCLELRSTDLVNLCQISSPDIFKYQLEFLCSEKIETYSAEQIELLTLDWCACLCDLPDSVPLLLSLPSGIEFVSCLMACFRLGKMVAPIISSDVTSEGEYFLTVRKVSQKSKSTFVVAPEKYQQKLKSMGLTPILKGVRENLSPQEKKEKYKMISDPQRIAVVQFSSGSTRDPKGILLTHRQILNNLEQINFGLNPVKERFLVSWLPFYHDMGLIGGLLGSMFVGHGGLFMSPADFLRSPKNFLKLVALKKAAMLVGPDFMYRLLLKTKATFSESLDLSSLKMCLTGSESVSAKTCDDFENTFRDWGLEQNVVMPVYGMAEVGLALSFAKPLTERKIQKGFVSCGKPLPGTQFKIDPNDQQIYVQSNSLCQGFYGEPDLYSQVVQDGWLETGDLGFLHENEIYIIGRKKDILIRNGQKYFPAELEERLYQSVQGQVGRVAVVEVKNEIFAMCEISVLSLLIRKKIRNQFVQELKFSCPLASKNIYFVAKKSLPRTSSGKIKRYEIRNKIEKNQKPDNFFISYLSVFKQYGSFLWQKQRDRLWKR